jgi:hypothetical protein
MRCIKSTLYSALFLFSCSVFSQDDFDVLGESSLSLNQNISKEYTMNFTFRSRYFLHKDAFQYKQQQVDFFHFSTFKLNFIHKLSFGVYYRNRDWFDTGSDELRFMEQFNYIKQRLGVRYGHRFRLEQRIFDGFTSFRQRYRFAVDFPLNGEKLDVGEAYFVGSTEALLSISKKRKPLLDQRFTTQIGWQINKDLKLQTGLEYRLESYNASSKNFLFVLSSVVCKL